MIFFADRARRGADFLPEAGAFTCRTVSAGRIFNANFAGMEDLKIYDADLLSELDLPYADGGVRAGFPSPAQDYMDRSIDLNRELVPHPESTFYGRVEGDSMEDRGIFEGDIMVIDKSLEPRNGDVAVCMVDGEYTVKFVEFHPDHVMLIPANPAYRPLRVEADEQFDVWGVVTYVIHKTR